MGLDELAWHSEYAIPVVVLATAIACCTFHNYLNIALFKRVLARRGASPADCEIRAPIYQRAVGVVLLGVVPTVVLLPLLDGPLARYGVTLHNGARAAGLGLIAGAIVVPFGLLIKRSPGLLGYYPEIRARTWTPRLVVINADAWIGYLAAYELLFRGFLLFTLVRAFGTWPGIVMTSGLYSFSHFPKHWIEGLIVMVGGVVFGVLTLATGSLIAPWIMHVVIAVSVEMLAVRAHADMRFVR